MIGMTDNSILFLGFRKKGDWTKGLSGEHPIAGDSKNTGKDSLELCCAGARQRGACPEVAARCRGRSQVGPEGGKIVGSVST